LTTTKVTLRYFASVREALDSTEEVAEVKGGSVADVLMWLVSRHGDELIPLVFDTKKRLRKEYRLLHNGSVCPRSAFSREKVSDGDEIILLPPVAGG
jgi:MoaD family protein